jgi:hypothetical protein
MVSQSRKAFWRRLVRTEVEGSIVPAQTQALKESKNAFAKEAPNIKEAPEEPEPQGPRDQQEKTAGTES